MSRKPEPKREKREWVKHEVHCRCDVALEEALNALEKLMASPIPPTGNQAWVGNMNAWIDSQQNARAVLAKYSSKKQGGGEPNTKPSKSAKGQRNPTSNPVATNTAAPFVSSHAEVAQLNARLDGGYEG